MLGRYHLTHLMINSRLQMKEWKFAMAVNLKKNNPFFIVDLVVVRYKRKYFRKFLVVAQKANGYVNSHSSHITREILGNFKF